MATFTLETERLPCPEAWPDSCARCSAVGTQFVPVPMKYRKKLPEWSIPLCAKHRADWERVRSRNRIGMLLALVVMLGTAFLTWSLFSRFAGNAVGNDMTRWTNTLVFGLLSGLPAAGLIAIWAKTPIRVEKIQGRIVTVAGVCKAFARRVAEWNVPAPLPEIAAEVRFPVEPYKPVASCPPVSLGLLFGSMVFVGGLFGAVLGWFGPQITEATRAWPRNGWNFVGLTVLSTGIVALALFPLRSFLSRLGLGLLGFGLVAVAVLSILLKWIGPQSWFQFGMVFACGPILVLAFRVYHPILRDGRVRHPGLAAVCGLTGPLILTAMAYFASGESLSGPQSFLYVIGPIGAITLAVSGVNEARAPYCSICEAWLTSLRLGSIPRLAKDIQPVVATGAIVSLVGVPSSQAKASIGDVELNCFSCLKCRSTGTVVLELKECRPSGKNESPTLFTLGRWLYPGAALPVITQIFPLTPEEALLEDSLSNPPTPESEV